MATLQNRHNPSFLLFPVNNNRTAWRPFGLPVVMVVPHRRTSGGDPLANSNAFNVRVYIEDVPREALVAGHDNVGKRFPDRELYSESITSLELADRFIVPRDESFTDSNGNAVEFADAKIGDSFTYTTASGITDTIPYLPDADYYDLSDILIDVELLPADIYNLVYETEYFSRVISQDELQEFLCIDASSVATARLKFELNHPGDVINEFYNLTPPPYLTNTTKALDTTIGLYRPFTDTLQDIFDEQKLLERINWVFETPAEAIPYISSLLGWELPYFPESLDALRKAVLRRTVEFQNLSGSRRAISNVFRLFGFEILITNLWWSDDGERFIRPGERLPAPYQDQEIEIEDVCQVDLVLDAYQKTGFGELEIPLLFRPQVQSIFGDFSAVRDGGDITLEAYRVTRNTPAYDKLLEIAQAISNDPENYGSKDGCFVDSNGFINSSAITNNMNSLSTDGFSQILISGGLGQPSNQVVVGNAPIIDKTVSFDREENTVSATINGYFDSEDQAIFMFAIYERQKIVVPSIIEDLQSNRFDIQVLTQNFAEFADPVTLEFAIEFLYRLKAFHSLLNLIRTRIELTETYEVTDWCVGGDSQMRYDTDAGQLQVPPAIIPDIPGAIDDCTLLDPQNLGYKESDILLRLRKLANLPEEFDAWKALDNRSDDPQDGLSLRPIQGAPGRDECRYTYRGQDRITGERQETRGTEYGPAPNSSQQIAGIPENPKASPNDVIDNGEFDATGAAVSSNSNSGAYSSFNREYTEVRDEFCELDGIEDYCYKGRVDDELLFRGTILNDEYPRCKPCSIGMGIGLYYTFPALSTIIVPGVAKPCPGSKTERVRFSGLAQQQSIRHYLTGIQGEYLSADYNKPLSNKSNSLLGRLYRAFNKPADETLHYHNRGGMPSADQRHNLALERPSLEIEKATMHLPGCRFPMMNKLEEDFIHPTWDARPWDDEYSTHCGPRNVCGDNEPSFLNFELIEDSEGNETLVFDSVPFSIAGNGLIPDIPSFGDHTLMTEPPFLESEVVHAVYMQGADDSPYVTLDQVCDYDTAVSSGVIETDDPLFNSHNQCGTDEILDYADGYPCLSGFQDFAGEDFETWGDVLDGLGMPTSAETGKSVLFLFGSGIRDRREKTLRFDCGCLVISCDGTDEGLETICSADLFLDDDGNYDWDCDHLEVNATMKLVETVGTCSTRLDGTIPSFLEVL